MFYVWERILKDILRGVTFGVSISGAADQSYTQNRVSPNTVDMLYAASPLAALYGGNHDTADVPVSACIHR